MSLDVVIAHRGDEIGLWMTVSSLKMQEVSSEPEKKVHIVVNGTPNLGEDFNMTVESLHKWGVFGSVQIFDEPLSPPSARNRGAEKGTGDTILFLDNHVLLERNFVYRGLGMMSIYGMDALHGATRYWPDGLTAYHYRFTLERNFWGYQVKEPLKTDPYLCAGAGHGAFFIRRKVWEEIGGYWDGFVGYGGEEPYLELKLAMMDYKNWLDPELVHYHHPGKRPYVRDKGDDFIKNMIAVAFIIGGTVWARRVLNGFKIIETRNKPETPRDLDAFYTEAVERAIPHATELRPKFKRSLNEQLVQFSRQGIAL
jgi:glycosyltransferase involved in cell wall biosynthesis